MLTLSVAEDLRPIVALGALTVSGARVVERDGRLDGPIADAERAIRGGRVALPDATRAMYRRLGIDPTKTRPSSEALLRRIRKGEPLPRINTLVDICNWCSVELQLSYGLYDLAVIAGPVLLRYGLPDEEYPGIRKDTVHLGGRPVLADARGPFGNPTSDSARTRVTASTTDAMIVVFAPAGHSAPDTLRGALVLTASRVTRLAGAVETGRTVQAV